MESKKSGANEILTKRERQITELVAWGSAKKEIPGQLQKIYGGKEISIHTVETIVHRVMEKTGLTKSTELAAWWFCETYGISPDEAPMAKFRKTLLAVLMLIILIPQTINPDFTAIRMQCTRATTTRVVRTAGSARAGRTSGSRTRKD